MPGVDAESENAFRLLEREIAVGPRLQVRDTHVTVEAGTVVHAIDPMGRRTPSPGQTNRGSTKLAGSSRVSRTKRRMDSLDLNRRGR